VSRHDSPEGDGSAPQKRHSLWSTVQAAITGGWATTLRLLMIMAGFAALITLLGHGAGTPVTALLQLIR
jgi:hypothetical protein